MEAQRSEQSRRKLVQGAPSVEGSSPAAPEKAADSPPPSLWALSRRALEDRCGATYPVHQPRVNMEWLKGVPAFVPTTRAYFAREGGKGQ
jgi:hypothetical protein